MNCQNTLGVLLFLFSIVSWGSNPSSQWVDYHSGKQVALPVRLFLSSTCPHCLKADEFFHDLETQNAWLHVHRYFIDKDKKALKAFYQFLQLQGESSFEVPTVFFCDSRWVGFEAAENTGKHLLRGLNYCRQQVAQAGKVTLLTKQILNQWAKASWIETGLRSKPYSLMEVSGLLAVADALNPCAFFGILVFLSLIGLSQTRSMQLFTGLCFLVGLSASHFIQQTQLIYFYQILSSFRILALAAGLGLVAVTLVGIFYGKRVAQWQQYGFLILAPIIGLGIQVYQQACLPNFALVFEQRLSVTGLTTNQQILYELMYQGLYLVPLVAIMLGLIFVGRWTRFDRFRLLFMQFSNCILIIVGGFFVFYPQGLSNFWSSVAVFLFSLFCGWISLRKRMGYEQIN